MACTGKNNNLGRKGSPGDNTEQPNKPNDWAAGWSTTLLLGCKKLLFKYAQSNINEKDLQSVQTSDNKTEVSLDKEAHV